MTDTSLARRLQDNFEAFADPTRDTVSALLADYADDVVFEDPFNVVRGKPAVEKAFRNMVRVARSIRIVTADRVESIDRVWFSWRFDFTPRRGPTFVIEGATLFRIRDGRVIHHRDYWDTLETLGLSMPWFKTFGRRLLRLAE